MSSVNSDPALGSPASRRSASRASVPKGVSPIEAPASHNRSQAVLSPSEGIRISTSVSPVSSVRTMRACLPPMSCIRKDSGVSPLASAPRARWISSIVPGPLTRRIPQVSPQRSIVAFVP